ncbi:MAG: hypothetical protein K1X88_25345 [Nannocystaceae bacterium]|nr:hypothetical protein [Nannocystaceae bacterium]
MMLAAAWLALLLAAPAAATGAAPVEPTAPASDDAPAREPVASPGALAVDAVLPCGLRVLIARDLTLPVVASVLAVETGTEDDPKELPGLVHALAFHLLEGNREWSPGGITRMIHDGGGVTSLAVGAAQVRFEALAPASLLEDLIAAEASRLRAPSVSEALWKDALRWARRDRSRGSNVPPAVRALAFDVEGLAHDGRVVTPELEAQSPRAIEAQLAERFAYDRASLVLITPQRPELVFNLVLAAFSDLPPGPRRSRDRTTPPRTGAVPRELSIKGGGGALVWPIAPDPASQAWASVLCGAVNRLKRAASEPTRVRLRCAIEDEPRRAVMVLRPSGSDDPVALVRQRFERLRTDELELLDKERATVAEQLAHELRTPLSLARHLARNAPVRASEPETPGEAPPMRALAELLATTALQPLVPEGGGTPDPWPPALASLFELGGAVRAVEPAKAAPK